MPAPASSNALSINTHALHEYTSLPVRGRHRPRRLSMRIRDRAVPRTLHQRHVSTTVCVPTDQNASRDASRHFTTLATARTRARVTDDARKLKLASFPTRARGRREARATGRAVHGRTRRGRSPRKPTASFRGIDPAAARATARETRDAHERA